MRSSYCGSVIGPKMSVCTLPRMFMPAPWIIRTFGIDVSPRAGGTADARHAGAGLASRRGWHAGCMASRATGLRGGHDPCLECTRRPRPAAEAATELAALVRPRLGGPRLAARPHRGGAPLLP